MPMEPTRFPEPLRSFVIYISEVFDEEKERLAKVSEGSNLYIPKPRSPECGLGRRGARGRGEEDLDRQCSRERARERARDRGGGG